MQSMPDSRERVEADSWNLTQKPVALGCCLVRTLPHASALVPDNAFGNSSFLVAAHLRGGISAV